MVSSPGERRVVVTRQETIAMAVPEWKVRSGTRLRNGTPAPLVSGLPRRRS